MKLLRPLLISAILLLGSTLSGHSAQEMGNGVCETTATSGTGTVNLAGTYPPYSTFVSQITSGASVTYRITTGTGASIKVETGTGTFTDGAPDTLTRDAEWTTDDQSAPITELTLAGTSTVCLTTAKSTFLGDKGDITFGAGFTTATVDADSVALGTDTTGNYAASGSEGGSATSVAANSVALTTDTTGNYAAGDGEAGNALTGDSATSFFSSGTVDDARIDGSAEVDEITLAGDVDGTGNSNDLDEANVEAELEGVLDLGDMQGDLTGTRGISISGDIYSSTNGSSSGAPRTWGFGDLTVDEYARIQYGDPYNAFQSGYGQRSQVYAYHGIELQGARAAATALPFVGGGSGADPSVSIIGNGSSSALWVEGGQVSLDTGLGIEFNAATDSTFTCASGACTIEGATVAELGSIALGTDTTGNYALGDAEGGAATTGDSATAFFSAGTVDDARIDGSAEADEVNPTLGTQTQGNYVDNVTGSATTGVAVTHTPAEGSEPAVAFDYTDKGASPSLSADTCVFSGDATTNGEIVCEGDTADTIESRIVVTDPTASDKTFTIGNGTTYSLADADKGDITVGTSGTDFQVDADAIGANEISAGAVGTSEAAALDAGDITTGTFADAQVSGANEADELTLAGDVDGTANSNDIDEANVEAELEGVIDEADLQVSDQGTDPALASDRCAYTTDTTTAGFIVCEGDTANTAESRMDFGDPSADRVFTLPDANSWPVTDRDYGDITVSASGQTVVIDGDSVALTTDTTGNYAAGDGEAGNALTGDSATSFFSSGTIEDARIDGSAEADEVLNSDKGDFTCTTGSCAIDSWPTFNRQIVTATGTYTPTASAISFFVRCQAPGGGGGGADTDATTDLGGGGGGGGQYAEIHYTAAEMGANAAVTIGAVGAASDGSGGNGGAGGDTIFNPAGTGGSLTVDGGAGGEGTGNTQGTEYCDYGGGAGGSAASGGDFEVDGGAGDPLICSEQGTTDKNVTHSGRGGDAVLGHGGAGLSTPDFAFVDTAGNTGQSYGGGGGGALDDDATGSAGGAGGPSICIIDELIEG
jgi:hypothetical protein